MCRGASRCLLPAYVRSLCVGAAAILIFFGATVASAAPPDEPAKQRAIAASTAFGLGGGNLGAAAAASLGGRYWFAPSLAVGVEGGVVAQAELTFGQSAVTWFGAPEVTYRIGRERTWWQFSLAPGYARTSAYPADVCIVSPCTRPPSGEGHGYIVDFMAAHVWAPGAFVLGVGIRLDFVHPLVSAQTEHDLPKPQFVGTVQLVLGFAP